MIVTNYLGPISHVKDVSISVAGLQSNIVRALGRTIEFIVPSRSSLGTDVPLRLQIGPKSCEIDVTIVQASPSVYILDFAAIQDDLSRAELKQTTGAE